MRCIERERLMRVHLHTLCWNDKAMLDFFFRHYDPWVDRYYVFDDGSTDGTLERLQGRQDVVVARTPHSDPNSWVRSAQTIYNSDWKRSIGQADWVVVTNLDEHLFHPGMREHLEAMLRAGVSAIPSLGYQMMSDEFPASHSLLWRDHQFGAPWPLYSRLAIFRPDQIVVTNYSPGRHEAAFEGNVVFPEQEEVLNLHYKYLGFEETRARHGQQRERLGAVDVANGWGVQYGYSAQELAQDFQRFNNNLLNVHQVAKHNPLLRRWRAQD